MRYGGLVLMGVALSSAAWAEGEPKPLAATLRLDRHAAFAGTTITPDLRARVTTEGVGPLLSNDDARVQKRATGGMLDYYPDGTGQGFHLSAGTRYFARTNYARDAQRRTNGVLYAPDFRITGLRGGYKRYAPAATIGYTSVLAEKLVMGVEGGAMMGSAFADGPRAPGSSRLSSGLNPMAHLVFGLKF